MSKKKKVENSGLGIEDVELTLSRAEQFVENNPKIITRVLAAIIIVIGGGYALYKYYFNPRQVEAASMMYKAEQYFEQDSFYLALNGDQINYGFLEVIDGYKFTKAAKRATYCAGVCHLRLGEYDEAIDLLKKYDVGDTYTSAQALGLIADAYVELEDYDAAAEYFQKAANATENELIKPYFLLKGATVYEEIEDWSSALKNYETFVAEFPKHKEIKQAEIGAVKAKSMLN